MMRTIKLLPWKICALIIALTSNTLYFIFSFSNKVLLVPFDQAKNKSMWDLDAYAWKIFVWRAQREGIIANLELCVVPEMHNTEHKRPQFHNKNRKAGFRQLRPRLNAVYYLYPVYYLLIANITLTNWSSNVQSHARSTDEIEIKLQ